MLYGRDAERDRIGELLNGARDSRSGVLVIRGDPGVGKTALLDDTRERASDMHVLFARGVESESELPFAAVHQLLRGALGHVEALPGPQADALRGALGLEGGVAHERFLVSAACLSLLAELSERRPVLCVVDDAHWLDTASAEALFFVARRIEAEGIVMLFALRENDLSTFGGRDLPSLSLGGLDGEAAATLVSKAAGVQAPERVVRRLMDQTGGNALALLELPGALTAAQLSGEEAMPDALPLTEQVERVFLERVSRLPEETQSLLLVAAADDSEDLTVVGRAAQLLGSGAGALDAAERAGLVGVTGTRLEFRHPLVRSAVYGAATSSERRAAHRALADTLATDDEAADRCAWHLAASVVEYDEAAVRALEEAAQRAEARGGFMVAVSARERAAELSADDASRLRNLVEAARCATRAGADERAVALARRALPLSPDALQRGDLAESLGLAELRTGQPGDAVAMLVPAARDIIELAPSRALDLLLDAAWACMASGNFAVLAEVGEAAATVEVTPGDEAATFVVEFLSAVGTLASGDPAGAAPRLRRLMEWAAESADDPRWPIWAGAGAMLLGDPRSAVSLVDRGVAISRAKGETAALAQGMGILAMQHTFVQQFDEAVLAADEALRFAEELGGTNALALFRSVLAVVAAVRGDDDRAIELAEAALARAQSNRLPLALIFGGWALGLVDLGRGRWAEALDRFDTVDAVSPPFVRGLVSQTAPDRVEAAVRAGRHDHAAAVLEGFAAWAAASGAPWAPPRLAACRALLAEGDEATAYYEEAVELAAGGRVFDLGRIRLLFGEHLRREHRRADSRAHLRAALETFERLGATPWADRAAKELRATGETARKRDPSTFSQLTPQEVHISRLVAEGMSNREVAAQLYLSPRTIDYHLRKVFTKLGVTSRTQLARMTIGDQTVLEPA